MLRVVTKQLSLYKVIYIWAKLFLGLSSQNDTPKTRSLNKEITKGIEALLNRFSEALSNAEIEDVR